MNHSESGIKIIAFILLHSRSRPKTHFKYFLTLDCMVTKKMCPLGAQMEGCDGGGEGSEFHAGKFHLAYHLASGCRPILPPNDLTPCPFTDLLLQDLYHFLVHNTKNNEPLSRDLTPYPFTDLHRNCTTFLFIQKIMKPFLLPQREAKFQLLDTWILAFQFIVYFCNPFYF